MGESVLGKARNNWSWGPLQEGPGQCLGERVGANPLNNFAFFLIKHAKMMFAMVNIG